MTKTILLSITLFACTAWMAAQSSPSTGSQDSTTGQTSSQSSAGQPTSGASSSGMNNSGETTIRGCLNSSGGGYTLTDASGTTYQLQGDTSKLASHVNNEVEIKGTASASSGTGTAGSSTSSSASAGSTGASANTQMFNVTKVKKVSGSCNASK